MKKQTLHVEWPEVEYIFILANNTFNCYPNACQTATTL